MDKDQISRIREDLLSSNPELEGGLTDSAIEKAAERVLSNNAQSPRVEVKPPASAKPNEAELKTIASTESNVAAKNQEPSKALDNKQILEAVLKDLQGNGQKFTIENPDLANAVDQVLKMSRNE